jgi:hypothetical protein
MRLRVSLAALVILTALSFVSALAANGHGSMYLTTLPPGATVWLDGAYVGETPLFVDGLDSGRHRITFTRSGWQPESTQVDVGLGRVATVSAVLTQNSPQTSFNRIGAKGTLRVRGANDEKVFVDGVQLQSESLSVTAGDHILTIQRSGSKTTNSIRVYPDTTTTISLAPFSNVIESADSAQEELASLQDYVPPNDFAVSGDVITIHYKGIEVECAVGSRAYVFNGKPGTLTVAPGMIGDRPFLPLSLLHRIAGH